MFMGLSVPFVLVAAVILLALAGKSEEDPGRERPAALYLSFVTLVGVLLLLAGTFLTAHGAVELTDTAPTRFYGWTSTSEAIDLGAKALFEDEPITPERLRRLGYGSGGVNHDDDVSQLIGGLIIAAIAIALLRFHLPKLSALAATSNGPGARVYNRLLYVVCAVTLLAGLGAAGAGLYSIYGMIAPDTAGAGRVPDALRSFITALAVAAVAALLFREAWMKSDLAPVAVAAPEPDTEETAPMPVKKAARPRKAAPPKE